MQAPTLHPPTHRLLPYCLKEEVATLPLYWASLCQNSHDGPAFMLSHSVMSDSWQPHGLDSLQAPLSMGFSRQEYWRGLPFPSPGDLLDPGIKPRSLALQADSLPSEPPEKPQWPYSPPNLSPKNDTGSFKSSLRCSIKSSHPVFKIMNHRDLC